MFFLLFGFYNVWCVCGVLLFFTNHLAYNEKSLRQKYVFFPYPSARHNDDGKLLPWLNYFT